MPAPVRSRAISSPSAVSVSRTNRRETAERLVDFAVASTCSPTGSAARACRRAYGLIANFKPGHQETWVDYTADRAPLLSIGGEQDQIMPPSVNQSNAKHYKHSPALTEYYEFDGRDHWTCAAPGWESVADYALQWAEKHASTAHLKSGAPR